MLRIATLAAAAAALLAAAAHAETTKPGDKPPTAPPKTAPKAEKTAKPDTKTATTRKRVTYACDGGVNIVVTYPPEAQAKTGKVKLVFKDTTYFVRPVAGAEKWENKTIKLIFEPKGDEAMFEREGKPLAEKCKVGKPST